jgi:hypothetical protein
MVQRPDSAEQFTSLLMEQLKMDQELAEGVAQHILEKFVPKEERLLNEPYLIGLSDGIMVTKCLLDTLEEVCGAENRQRRRAHRRAQGGE